MPNTNALLLAATFAWVTPGVAASVDYAREVKPVLAEHCYECHGGSQHKSGLRLDTAALARKGGEHGPLFEPGKGAESLLIHVLTGAHVEIPRMPYKKPRLADAQVTLLSRWIDEGAIAPADEQPATAKHWAFLAPHRPPLPTVKRASWVRNPVDRFILARLEREGIAPSPEAHRVTLIRRLSLDLIGLPPTPTEVDAFANDARSDAYERLVERLLASPHYGERWGRWWLDAARYADSNGYSIDAPRSIWKYRDWVVAALNHDLPFDQFAIEQLAGDLLPGATTEQKMATGFHRNTQINQEGGIDPEQFRVETVLDRVNTTATVFLGVTFACGQCHDHKFDPFTQREYYQMFAFFNSSEHDGHGKGDFGPVLELPTPKESEARDAHRAKVRALEDELKAHADELRSKVSAWEAALDDAGRDKLKAEAKAALAVAADQRTTEQRDTVFAAFRDQDEGYKKLRDRLAKLKKDAPSVTSTLVMKELPQPRETHVFIKGDFTRPGDVVAPGVPAVLHPLAAAIRTEPPRLVAGESSGGPPYADSPRHLNRLDLARWIVAPDNPLTARVLVNRVWQQYFGKGIVETENDLGTQGARPTHPELLDWLAREFISPVAPVEMLNRLTVKSGAGSTVQRFNDSTLRRWSLKRLHRLIVTSATYRQSSKMRPELRDVDPTNKLLARQARLRLDAEIVRDACLASSGLLSPKMAGPPVNPPQPDGVMTLGQSKHAWKASASDDRHRRGLYTQFFRATPHPALTVFDAPDGYSACTRRIRANTPLQALTLLNDQQFYELAQGLAGRVLREAPPRDEARLEYSFRVCLARRPDQVERKRLADLLAQQLSRTDGDEADKLKEAWTTVARVLLNLDETITRE
ncbi:MAG: PSD1 domain-containing protein [Verrucomicrobia bacterium]|nr:PSD1 domain-containing protein [Verrucomicrobiota bacterium]